MDTVLKSLDARSQSMARHSWLPPDLLRLATEVTRLQSVAAHKVLCPSSVPTNLLPSPAAHAAGQPLLEAAHLPCPFPEALELWQSLLHLTEEMPAPMGESSKAVHACMQKSSKPLRPEEAFEALLKGDMVYFSQWEKTLPQAPAMPHFLAKAALTPWIMAASAALSPWHKADSVWEYGVCPHCGQLPLMGQLRDREGSRWHICSFCLLEYRVPRLQCPVCLEKDHQKLLFFTIAEEAGYESHVCESCKNYIKLRDMREMQEPSVWPALDDLDSLPLDLAARQQGYVRNTLSAWGF